MTNLQKQLCIVLQRGLPICTRPFAKIAEDLGIGENSVLEQITELKDTGIIRRIGAMINHRAIGKVSTLVTSQVPCDILNDVVEAVNSLQGVSHNYLREHLYNLWFTLQAQTNEEIRLTLSNLTERFGIVFYSMPVVRTFKLDVRFDLGGERQVQEPDEVRKPIDQGVELDTNERLVLSKLQDELELSTEPFSFLCAEGMRLEDILRTITGLIEKGVIRRISAILDHRRLGFIANVLFACEVPQQRILEAGERLARFELVSHCYERRVFQGWPYNLFAMMHGRCMEDIQRIIEGFVKVEKPDSLVLLPTITEFKKWPARYKFD